MIEPIYAISPKNKFRVKVGIADTTNRIATFDITERRYFREAKSFGPDANVFKRKNVNWCELFVFLLWDGRRYEISKWDFLKSAWLYQYGGKEKVFEPKLVISEEVAEKIKQNRPKTEDERLKALCQELNL